MFYHLPYLLFCVWLAYDNSDRIADGRKIHHALNGSLHLAAAGIMYYIKGWQDAISLLLLVRVVFDSSLNLFRGLSLGYVSPKPKSWVDKIEAAVFNKNGLLPKLIYLIIVICLQTIK